MSPYMCSNKLLCSSIMYQVCEVLSGTSKRFAWFSFESVAITVSVGRTPSSSLSFDLFCGVHLAMWGFQFEHSISIACNLLKVNLSCVYRSLCWIRVWNYFVEIFDWCLYLKKKKNPHPFLISRALFLSVHNVKPECLEAYNSLEWVHSHFHMDYTSQFIFSILCFCQQYIKKLRSGKTYFSKIWSGKIFLQNQKSNLT